MSERTMSSREIIVTSQAELDALPASFDEYTRIIIKDTPRDTRIIAGVAREELDRRGPGELKRMVAFPSAFNPLWPPPSFSLARIRRGQERERRSDDTRSLIGRSETAMSKQERIQQLSRVPDWRAALMILAYSLFSQEHKINLWSTLNGLDEDATELAIRAIVSFYSSNVEIVDRDALVFLQGKAGLHE